MARKIVPIISVVMVSALGILFLVDSSPPVDNSVVETIDVSAIYYEEQGVAEIRFNDYSLKTNSVTLEILGMENSFQKTFHDYSFVERIPFDSVPKYGWEIHPITLVIDHQEFGKIGIKTEIHSQDEQATLLIYNP